MSTGTVIFFDDQKGYGFIRPDDCGGDVFCHSRALVGVSVLQKSQRVSFDSVFDDARGKYRAADVRVI